MKLLGIDLTEKEFDHLMCEQSKGKQLKVVDNKVVAVEHEPSEQEVLENLRIQRKFGCFDVVNRGFLWYETLNEQQIYELRKWYNDWLDVTKTKIVPQKPQWLNV